MIERLYVDGGVIKKNPSTIGGTWAWCHVSYGHRILTGSGFVTPEQIGLPTVSNNLTELLAAINGLESLPDGWIGDVYTDSNVTLLRITLPKVKFNGIPQPMIDRLRIVQKRLGGFSVHLLGCHPNRTELAAGIRKDGFMVSEHNVWCDKECGRQAEACLASLKA